MRETPLTLVEVRAAAKRAADEIDKTWPQWKKDLSEPAVVRISTERTPLLSYKKQHRLPDGQLTQDLDKYIDAWKSLGNSVCSLFGGRAHIVAFGGGIQIAIKHEEIPGHEYSLTLDGDFAGRIQRLIQENERLKSQVTGASVEPLS